MIAVSIDVDDVSTLDLEDFPIACPKCGSQMRLFAIEWEGKRRDIYTFVCDLCGHTAARGVQTNRNVWGRRRRLG
jgi:hypothetical protein